MKVLSVGDIHGKHELVAEAFGIFIKEKYDRIIYHGDTADGFDRTNEDIVRCFNILLSAKKVHPDKVILLMGNHDEPYFHQIPEEYRCQGFRPDLHAELSNLLIPNRSKFNYAHGISNYLFTHAGVSSAWFLKHFDTLDNWATIMGIDITEPEELSMVLEGVSQTHDKNILFEIGPDRNGYLSDFGGPLWCDRSEIMDLGPIIGLNQIVGHTSQQFITRVHEFEGGKKYKNTSVTFIDVLAHQKQFLTLEIK